MNKNLIWLSTLAVLAALSISCRPALAQGDKEPPPTPPYIQTSPAGSKWAVEIIYKNTPKEQGKKDNTAAGTETKEGPPQVISRPVRLEMKIGRNGIRKGTITYSDKREEEFFVVGKSLLQDTEGSGRVSILPLEMLNSDIFSLRVSTFPGLSWLSPASYQGIKIVDEVPCWYFYAAKPPGVTFWEGALEAWIRVEDKKPIRVVIKDTEYKVSDVSPFTDDIQLPPAFIEIMNVGQKRWEAMEVLRQMNKRR